MLKLVKSMTDNYPLNTLELYSSSIGGYFYFYIHHDGIATYLPDELYNIIIDIIFKYYGDFIIGLNNTIYGR